MMVGGASVSSTRVVVASMGGGGRLIDTGDDGQWSSVELGGGARICNGSVFFFLSNLQLDYILSYRT